MYSKSFPFILKGVIFLLLINGLLYSQNTFSKFYGNQFDEIINAVEAPDGSLYFLGQTTHLGSMDQVLVKADSTGNLIWNRALANTSTTDRIAEIALHPQGGVITLSAMEIEHESGFLLTHYDSQGNQIWQQTLGPPDYEYYTRDLLVLSNGTILVLADDPNHYRSQWYFFTLSGNLIRAREFSTFGGGHYRFFGVAESGGALYFAGSHRPNNSNTDQAFVMRTNLSGVPVWTRASSSLPMFLSICESPDGDLIALSSSAYYFNLLKFSPAGNVTRSIQYTPPGGMRVRYNNIQVNASSDFILSGSFKLTSSIHAYPMVSRIDTTGYVWGSWVAGNHRLENSISLFSQIRQKAGGGYLWGIEQHLVEMSPNLDFCGRYSVTNPTISLPGIQLSSISTPNVNIQATNFYSTEYKEYSLAISQMDFCQSNPCGNLESIEIIADINGRMCEGRPLRFHADPAHTNQLKRWYLNGNPLDSLSTQVITFSQRGRNRVSADYEVAPGCIKRVDLFVEIDSCYTSVPSSYFKKDLYQPTGRFADFQTYPGGGFIGIHREPGFNQDSAYVVRLDPEGQIVWSKRVDFVGPHGNGLYFTRPLANGNILLTGYQNVNPFNIMYFILLDGNGNFISKRSWRTDLSSFEIKDVVLYDTSAIYLCGGDINSGAWLAKFDQSGQAQWFKSYQVVIQGNPQGASFQRINVGPDGNLWLGSINGQVGKVDSSGNILMYRYYEGNFPNVGTTSIRYHGSIDFDSNGDVVFSGGGQSSNGAGPFILKLSPSGTPRWCRSAGGNNSVRVYRGLNGYDDETVFGIVVANQRDFSMFSLDAWGNPLSSAAAVSNFGAQFDAVRTRAGFCRSSDGGYVVATGPSIQKFNYNLQSCTGNTVQYSLESGLMRFDTLTSYTVNSHPFFNAPTGTIPLFPSPRTDSLVCESCPDFSNFTVSSVQPCTGVPVSFTPSLNGSVSYEWFVNGQFFSNSINPSYAFLTPGTYTIQLKTSGAVCIDSSSQTISVNGLAFTAGNDQSICSGGSAQLGVSGGQTFQWSPATGLSATNIQNPTASPLSTTTYVVTVGDGAGCFGTDSVQINVNANPTVSAGSNIDICAGNTANLMASASGGSPGYSFLWSNGATTSATAVTPVANSSFTVTVTDANLCTSTDSVQVSVNANPAVSAGSNIDICAGNTANLMASASGGSPGYSFLWSNGATTSATAVAPVANSSFTVTVTDANLCTSTDSVQINVNANPTVSAGPNIDICAGNTANLMASVSGGSPGYSFLWSNGATTSATAVTPVTNSSFTVTVTDANLCTSTDSVQVSVNANPLADFSFLVNSGTTYDFTDLSSGSLVSWFWNFGDGTNSTASNPQHTFPQIDTYFVCLTVTDSNGCKDSLCQTVPPDPTSREIKTFKEVNIWPNPSPGIFNLEVKGDMKKKTQIRVYDARGRVVFNSIQKKSVNFHTRIDLSTKASGLYLLELIEESGRLTRRLVLER